MARYPGTKTTWNGFDRYTFRHDRRQCLIVAPKTEAAGRPWVWRARFFGAFAYADVALLKKGFHVAYMDVGGMYGNAHAVRHWNAFYAFLTGKHGFAKKMTLEGFSRGGLMIYNWAARNPRKVNCIYGDAPVCDIKSWPAGKGKGVGSRADWNACKQAYDLSEKQALRYMSNPVDRLAPLAKAKIPILHVCGAADAAVPMAENSDVVEKRYRKLGGDITVIAKPGCGHHPHSLKDPTPIVNFICRNTPGMGGQIDPEPAPGGRVYYDLRAGLANSRIRFKRTRKGRVAFLGGSITQASGWRNMLCKAIQRQFPATTFDFIPAGIGSIDSTGDAFRLWRDVLAKGRVDLMFIDASVNDYHNGRAARQRVRAMEGIVRQARAANPAMDIVVFCFVDAAFLEPLGAGRVPPVVADHLAVAKHYRLPSLNLAKEVAERIQAGQFPWETFRDCHPSPFGHRLYAYSMAQMLLAAWKAPLPRTAVITSRRLPAAIDKQNYCRARLVDVAKARAGGGWTLVKRWRPKDRAAARPHFSSRPVLVAEQPGAELTLTFEGTAVGVFVNAGPDVGIIEYSIDGGKTRRLDQFTRWSPGLHIPWAYVLDADLKPGKHRLSLRTTDEKNPAAKGHACRIVHFLVNRHGNGPVSRHRQRGEQDGRGAVGRRRPRARPGPRGWLGHCRRAERKGAGRAGRSDRRAVRRGGRGPSRHRPFRHRPERHRLRGRNPRPA